MRKIYQIFVAISLILMLYACNKPEKKTFQIGFSQCTMNDNWRKTMVKGMESELAFHNNIGMTIANANSNSARQIAQIQQFIDEKVDLIIVTPNEAKPLTAIIEKAFDAGIPVVIVDRKTTSEKYTAFVGADNKLIGQNAGIYANIILRGQGTIFEVGEGAKTSPTIDRHQGFLKVINKNPQLQLVKSLFSARQPQYFQEEIRAFLNQHPNVDLIYAHNDRLAHAIANVCKSLGLNKKIIGVDGLYGANEGIDLVSKGIISATILYPTGGEEAIKTAVKILNKQPFEKENQLFTTIINTENVGIMLAQYQKIKEQQDDITRQASKIKELTRIFSTQQNTLYLTVTFLLVVISLGGILFYLLREKQKSNQVLANQNRAILEQKDEIERISQLARQATEDKLRFYSYISHEFRTPLSLILTPTEDILHRKSVDIKETRNALQLIYKNANRLLRLVDQLLELRKVDAGKMELEVTQQDLVAFVKDIVSDFNVKAKTQHIDLQFICPFGQMPFGFDAEKLDKVLFNIISNAFKYTPVGGLIHVSLLKNIEKIEILISDNGIGMSKEEKERAFDLFYRGNQNISLGTGLGLALSREFVSLHQGDIEVESEKGKGTTFKIILPYVESQVIEKEPIKENTYLRESVEPITPMFTNNSVVHDNTIVLIEDNQDLNQFLTQKLRIAYNTVPVESAEKGWEEILNNIPDLIISDVMLPEMDGFTLTQKIKNDFRTSHIPVILLTAKGQMESQIEGAKAGADAYISKPFNQQLLEEKIKGLLENRDRMRRRFSSEITNPSQIQKTERKFLVEFELLIEKNLNDSSLSVEKLSKELGMSRVQLFRKISALTNKNVTDYIADFKLLKAKALLKETDKTIAEVAYETGFNNPSYFTTFFKQKTNQTPSEWRNS